MATNNEVWRVFDTRILTDTFWDTIWESQPYVWKPDSQDDVFSNWLSIDEVTEIFSTGAETTRFFANGQIMDFPSFSPAYLSGCSMVVNTCDRYSPKIYHICRRLASKYFYHVFAVLYFTPPNASAVPIHSDDQDVFLLQVWGQKRWKVYSCPHTLPFTEESLGKDSPVPESVIGDTILEFDLKAGEMLYIPRGLGA